VPAILDGYPAYAGWLIKRAMVAALVYCLASYTCDAGLPIVLAELVCQLG